MQIAWQKFRRALRASRSQNTQTSLDRFLLAYRNSPHTTTKETPAKLFIGRALRSRLDLLKPNLAADVADRQVKQPSSGQSQLCQFDVGHTVLVRNYRGGDKWVSGTVKSQSGPVSYSVVLRNGSVLRRHIE